MKPDKPPLPPLPSIDQVPEELRPLRRWVGWRATWDPSKEKWRKPPHSPVTGEAIGAVEKYAEHWLTFAEAMEGIKKHGLDGPGFVFKDGDGYVGIDFDDCRNDGRTHNEIGHWLKWFPTYLEISPSGTGVHAIGKGKINKALTATEVPKADGAKVEIYCKDRYFTYTGQRIGEHNKIGDCQVAIEKLLTALKVDASNSKPAAQQPRPLTKRTALKLHQENLSALRDAKEGEGNALINTTAFFAARAFAAKVFDDRTDEDVKNDILHIVLKEWKKPHPEHGAHMTVDSGWRSGLEAPLVIIPEARELLTRFAADYMKEVWEPELGCPTESVLWLKLSDLNAKRCDPPLPSPELRRLSVELFEKLTGEKVAVHPGMFEDEDQPDTDLGFGKHLAREFGRLARYNPDTQEWLVYGEGVWRVDPGKVQVRKLLKDFFYDRFKIAKSLRADLWAEFEPISDWFFKDGRVKEEHADDITPEQRAVADVWFKVVSPMFAEALNGQSVKRLLAGLESAETEDLNRYSSDWDSDPLLLNVRNATIDLATGQLLADRLNTFCTMQGGVNFDDGATCPEFEKALAFSLPDASVRAFIQDYSGLTLSGLMTPEILILLGEGANGKGLLLRIFSGVLGAYYKKASMTTFLSTKNPQPGGARSDLAALRGKRLITAAEANRKVSIDMELLKDWTGGEDFNVRDVWEKAKDVSSKPQGKLILSMNKPPKIVDTTHAAWRRLRYINFNVIIPSEKRNDRFADELLATEGPGILNWMLAGWWRVAERLAADKPALEAPKVVLDDTAEYKEKESQAAQFFEDEIVLKFPDGKVTSADLYARYKGWCARNGEFPFKSQNLILELTSYCNEKGHKVDWGKHNHHAGEHRGIELRPSALQPSDQEPESQEEIPF